jgi:hypothetical protein
MGVKKSHFTSAAQQMDRPWTRQRNLNPTVCTPTVKKVYRKIITTTWSRYMFKSVARLATGCLLMSAAICASAADTAYQDFSVAGVFQEVLGPSLRCPTRLGGTMTGYGASPTLGRIVFLGGDCVTPSGSMFTFSEGRFILTTLDGELVYASYSGQAVANTDPTHLTFTGATFQITGGTGRYKHATGGGTLDGTESVVTSQGNIALKGRILLQKE